MLFCHTEGCKNCATADNTTQASPSPISALNEKDVEEAFRRLREIITNRSDNPHPALADLNMVITHTQALRLRIQELESKHETH